MEILNLKQIGIDASAKKAAEVLREGGVFIYPTDTLYGLGADALSDRAVDTIYKIKGREIGKPIHAIVVDIEMASQYAEVNETANILAKAFLPGPLTLILMKKAGVVTGIGREIDTFGFRIPDHPLCTALTREFGGPITTTSANVSGEAPPRSVKGIAAQLGGKVDLIDLALDDGEPPENPRINDLRSRYSESSSVVDVSGEEPRIIRVGAIPAAEISRILAKK